MINNKHTRACAVLLALITTLMFGCNRHSPTGEDVTGGGAFTAFTVPDANVYSENFDVIVVGAGLAGLSAATTALEAGASVVVIEKMPAIGGNSIYSNGTFNAVDPARQSAQGIEDSLELFIKQTYEGGGSIGNLDLIGILCERAGDARDWMQSNGVTWDERGVYLPSGGVWPRSLDAAYGANESFIRPLAASVVELGGNIIRDYRVVALVGDSERIIGVRAVQMETGEQHVFWASRGVILATGGFGSNTEMIAKYCEELPKEIEAETTPAATGDGILLALSTGAQLVDMQYVQMVPGAVEDWAYLTNEISCSIYVNTRGERFVSEQLQNNELCDAILQQPDEIAYAIFDSNTIRADFKDDAGRGVDEFIELSEQGLCGYGETLDELALSIGVDAKALKESVERFNSAVDGEAADPFGRELFFKRLGDGPFFASCRTAKIHYTMGGLRIDSKARVISEETGAPIPNLYACGEVTGGIHGANHVTGNALADCVVFGRIAGESACCG